MLWIKSITLKGIKVFKTQTEFRLAPYEGQRALITLSGANGSGKSAIVESLAVVQEAGILHYLENHFLDGRASEKREEFVRKLENISTSKTSIIKLSVTNGEEESDIKVEIFWEKGGTLNHHFSAEEGPAREIYNSWVSSDPRDLIVAVPSTKYFEQEDIYFTRLQSGERESFVFEDAEKEELLSPLLGDLANGVRESYRRVLENWFYERIVPGKKRTVFNKVANVYLNYLFKNIKFENISGTFREGEIVSFSKRTDIKGGKYDLRGMSSGEKYVYLIFSYLAKYAGRSALIIFDEPENHLHEQSLVAFVDILGEQAGLEKNYLKDIVNLSKKTEVNFSKDESKRLNKVFGGWPFTKSVLMVTHSKLLVRRNLDYGANFLVDKGEIFGLGKSDVESKLRKAGVSQIDERFVFVEGETDKKIFDKYFKAEHVEVKGLTGKDSVCSAFEGFASIDDEEKRPGYAFVLDKDSGLDYKYEDLEKRFPYKWHNHVIVLDRVEIENYLLDPILIKRGLESFVDKGKNSKILDVDYIDSIIKDCAERTREERFNTYIGERLRRESNLYFPIPSVKSEEFKGKEDLSALVDNVYSEENLEKLKEQSKTIYGEAYSIFYTEHWDNNWRSLCKGKKVFPGACNEIASQIHEQGIKGQFIKDRTVDKAVETKGSDLRTILDKTRKALEL